MSTIIRRGLVLAGLLLAAPGLARAAEVAVKAACACCGLDCPLGCC